MEFIESFTLDAQHVVPLVIVIFAGFCALKLIKGVIKWAVFIGLIVAALLYFHVI